MTTLVIAEHDNASLKASTLNAVAAATAIGGDVHVLVAGENAGAAATAAAAVAGVAKVLHADSAALGPSTAVADRPEPSSRSPTRARSAGSTASI